MTADATPRILIVDDDASVRDGLRRLLESMSYCVETFASAHAFFDAYTDLDDRPSCLILDVKLPGSSGLEIQRALAHRRHPPIVFLTAHGDIPTSVRAIKAGAIEFLTKPVQGDDLVSAIGEALARDRVTREQDRHRAEIRRRYATLTAREREVMRGVVAGRLNKQIAAASRTQESTVKEQRANVMKKMEASSLAELVRFSALLGDDDDGSAPQG